MSFSNHASVENEYQNGDVVSEPKNTAPVANTISDGNSRFRDVAELHNIAFRRKGISWAEFVFQIFITIEGPAIFIIPALFKDVGYLVGILGSVGISLFYMYTMGVLIWCDHYIQKKRRIKQQTLYSLVESVFDEYRCPRIGSWLNFYLKYEIVLSWTMGLSFGLFYINKNVQIIVAYFDLKTTDQFVLLCLLIPVMIMCWFPHIKAIAFFSYFVTITITAVIFEVLYYVIINPMENPRVVMINNASSLPNYLFSVFFILTFTPLIFPLKLEMKYPSNLKKIFGGINLSVILITLLNVLFPLVAYFKLGDEIRENIVDNLPENRVVLITNCMFVVSSIGAGALSFFMIFQTLWFDGWANYFKKSKCIKFYEYVVRSMLGLLIVLLAMVIPTFSLFINLISCFSYPYDSVLLPLILESVIVWNDMRSTTLSVLILIKNIAIGVFCVLACTVAFYQCLIEILSYYHV